MGGGDLREGGGRDHEGVVARELPAKTSIEVEGRHSKHESSSVVAGNKSCLGGTPFKDGHRKGWEDLQAA